MNSWVWNTVLWLWTECFFIAICSPAAKKCLFSWSLQINGSSFFTFLSIKYKNGCIIAAIWTSLGIVIDMYLRYFTLSSLVIVLLRCFCQGYFRPQLWSPACYSRNCSQTNMLRLPHWPYCRVTLRFKPSFSQFLSLTQGVWSLPCPHQGSAGANQLCRGGGPGTGYSIHVLTECVLGLGSELPHPHENALWYGGTCR